MRIETIWFEVVVRGLGPWPSENTVNKARKMAGNLVLEMWPSAQLEDSWPDSVDDGAWAFQFRSEVDDCGD